MRALTASALMPRISAASLTVYRRTYAVCSASIRRTVGYGRVGVKGDLGDYLDLGDALGIVPTCNAEGCLQGLPRINASGIPRAFTISHSYSVLQHVVFASPRRTGRQRSRGGALAPIHAGSWIRASENTY